MTMLTAQGDAISTSDGSKWGIFVPGDLESLQPGNVQRVSGLVIVRSGEKSVPVDAENAFRTWSPEGWKAFDESADRIATEIGDGGTLVIWPGPGSVLSDAVGTAGFCRRMPRVGVLVDPVVWVTESMLPDAEDHLQRIGHTLRAIPEDAVGVVAIVARPCGQFDSERVLKLLGADGFEVPILSPEQ